MKRRPQRPLTSTEVTAILAQHGVVPGADGYAWADLVALATQHGWHVRVEPDSTPRLGHHVRALVWSDGQLVSPTSLRRLSTKSRGATEEEALADALARLLIRAARGNQVDER